MKLSPGKLWGLRRLADANGLFKMVAIDQRTQLLGPIAKARGLAQAPYEDIARLKAIFARHLAPAASAILVDPNYGYSAAMPHVPPKCGLILCLEHHLVEDTPGGKRSRAIPDWSAAKIRRVGADAAKVLVWQRHDASAETKAHQAAFVADCGLACEQADLVYLLEILIYPLPGEDAAALPERRAERVTAAVADYLDPRFEIDIYKVEPPIALHDVPDPHGPRAAAAQAVYDNLAKQLPRPWVLLSAGAGAEDFARQLVYGYRAGASGYLCGRAIWFDSFRQFPDFAALERCVAEESVPYIERINALTDKLATPWHRHAGWGGMPEMTPSGADFATSYPAR